MNKPSYDIFISYSRRDKNLVEPVVRSLANSGISVWLDSWNLAPGQKWREALEDAIRNASAIAVFVGPSGFGTQQNAEVRKYIESRKQIIPILLPGAEPSFIPSDLQIHQWVDLRDQSMQWVGLNRLFAALGHSGISENRIDQEQYIADDLLVTGDLIGASERYEKALKIAQEQEIESRIVQLYIRLGNVKGKLGDYEAALSYLNQSLAIARQIDDKSSEGAALNNISQIYDAQGDYETALSYLRQSLVIAEQTGDDPGKATILNNLSAIYYAQGDYQRAMDYLKQSLVIMQKIGNKAGEGTLLNNLSQIYVAQGDYETALSYLKQSLAIAQQIGDKPGEGTALNNISTVYHAQGEHEKAVSYLRQSLAIRQQIGDEAGEGAVLINISQISKARGDYETALEMGDFAGAMRMYEGALTEGRQVDYARLVLLLANRERAKALEYAERARTRTFLDLLGQTSLQSFFQERTSESRPVDLNSSKPLSYEAIRSLLS